MRYLGRIFDTTKVILTDTAKKPEIIKITPNVKTIDTEGENVYEGTSMVMLDPNCTKIKLIKKETQKIKRNKKIFLLGYEKDNSIRNGFQQTYPQLFDTQNAFSYLFDTVGEDPILSYLALPNIANEDAIFIYEESKNLILIILADAIKIVDVKEKSIKEIKNKKHRPIETVLHTNKININLTTKEILEWIDWKKTNSFAKIHNAYLSICSLNLPIEEMENEYWNILPSLDYEKSISRLDNYLSAMLLNIEYPGYLTQLFTLLLGFGMTFHTEKLFEIKSKSIVVTTTSIKSVPYMIDITLSNVKSYKELKNKIKSELYDVSLFSDIEKICEKEKGIIPYCIFSFFSPVDKEIEENDKSISFQDKEQEQAKKKEQKENLNILFEKIPETIETENVIQEKEEKRINFTEKIKSLILEGEQLSLTIRELQAKYEELQHFIEREKIKHKIEAKRSTDTLYIIAQEDSEKKIKKKSHSPYLVEIDIRDYHIIPKVLKEKEPILIETTPFSEMLKKEKEENNAQPLKTLAINLDDYYTTKVERLTKSMLTANGNMVQFSLVNNIFTVYYDKEEIGSKHFTIEQDLYSILDSIVEENPVPSFTKKEFQDCFQTWTEIITKEHGLYVFCLQTKIQIMEMASRISHSNLKLLELILILLRWARITLAENPSIYEVFKETFQIPDTWEENGLLE